MASRIGFKPACIRNAGRLEAVAADGGLGTIPQPQMNRESKSCPACGRDFAWRRKWAGCWDRVVYCSARCRGQRVTDADRELERVIVELLSARARGASICPSEVAREVHPQDWRDWLEPARKAARRLVAAGTVELTQRGAVVDASRARGPIRIRFAKPID